MKKLRWTNARKKQEVSAASEVPVPSEVPITHHWKFRRLSMVLIFSAMLTQLKILSTTGSSDGLNIKHRTKHRRVTQRACFSRAQTFFSTGSSDDHRINASELPMVATSVVRRLNGYIRAQSDRKFRRPPIGSSDTLREKGTMTTNG